MYSVYLYSPLCGRTPRRCFYDENPFKSLLKSTWRVRALGADRVRVPVCLRPERLCVQWAPGATIGTLSSALASFQGKKLSVNIKVPHLWSLRSRQRRVPSSAPLHSFLKVPLEASAEVRVIGVCYFPSCATSAVHVHRHCLRGQDAHSMKTHWGFPAFQMKIKTAFCYARRTATSACLLTRVSSVRCRQWTSRITRSFCFRPPGRITRCTKLKCCLKMPYLQLLRG